MAFNKGQDAYQALRAIVSERTRPLIVWVGSGLSASAGLPTWAELKGELVEAASRRAADYNPTDAARLAADIDTIRRSDDYWVSFQRLKTILGPASYEAAIKERLAPAVKVDIPAEYNALWRLPVQGILTLNIDRLVARSHNAVHAGTLSIELSGPEIARIRNVLFGPQKFIGNLHGVVEDTSSWVFTHDDLSRLLKNGAYADFMRNCLANYTNLFVAINPDDRAIGSHLDALKTFHVQSAPNFWITDRRDAKTDMWAEERGIRVIRYDSSSGTHADLNSIFQDLETYISQDVADAPPVSALGNSVALTGSAMLTFEDDLSALSSSELRRLLNARAVAILAPNNAEAYEDYAAFSKAYDEEIYRAWYASTQPGKNDMLGFELQEEVARGAFGRVYRALSPAGEQVAVKVLLDEVRRDPALLASFRRGVRSMSILQQSNLPSMVQYLAASEIPAFVAMEWIEGPNLEEAKAARLLDDLSTVIEICLKITAVIRQAHSLPERVLHRDVRPANVMLRNYWTDPSALDVVVLDFDLSWHRGAAERSVVFTSASGYLAPEQQVSRPKESTRNAAVDSFGLGMTFFFLLSGSDPVPNQQMHRDWEARVDEAAKAMSGASEWQSGYRRFARIVVGATADSQHQRWDLARIENELRRLRAAVLDGRSESPELVAEELASRTPMLSRYTWDSDRQVAFMSSPSGLRVELGSDPVAGEITLEVAWARTGHEDRTGLTKYVREGGKSLQDRLKNHWKVSDAKSDPGSFSMVARRAATSVSADIQRSAQDLDDALRRVSF